jgi:AraC-like DNA-binding protein
MITRIEDFKLTPARPLHGGVVEMPYPAPLATDMHRAFELGVLLTGSEDRHFEDFVAPLEPGGIWLCGAWEPHGWRARSPGTQELVLQFLPDFLGEEMFDGVSWLSLFSAPPDQRPRLTDEDQRQEALGIAVSIRREMRERTRGWLAAIRLGILRLLLSLIRGWEPSAAVGRDHIVRTGSLERVMPAIRLVHSDPTRRLNLREAAAACGLSVSQFGFLFRNVMGLSFGKFCRRARLAYVAQLLLTTDLSVEAVAATAGFSDASHLHHAFAAAYGSTPARYRANGRPLTGEGPSTPIETVEVEDHRPPARYRAVPKVTSGERPYTEIERLDPEDYDTAAADG